MAQLSIIELIVRKTAVQLNIPESIVERVINHKHKAVHEALRLHTSVEDSGFGTYKVRPKVAIKRIAKVEREIVWITKQLQDGKETLTDRRIQAYQRMIETLIEEKRYLETKI